MVDFLKLEPAAHQSVHRQATLPIKLDVAGNVSGRDTRSDVTAFERSFFGHKIHRR